MPNAPHWGWYIILYFFIGGIASGMYVIGTLASLGGDPRDRSITRFAYLAVFPLVLLCGFLLIIDLGQPLRFWHMLIQSERLPLPVLKYWVPMSIGSWVLTVFGLFAFTAFLSALVDSGRLTNQRAVRVVGWARSLPRALRFTWTLGGMLFALFFGGYTGVLLVGTNVALWHHAQLLGAVFMLSAASTAYALLIFVLRRRGEAESTSSIRKLEVADRTVIIMELVAIVVMLVMLGSVARPLITGGFGVLFWVGVIGVGLLFPLVLPYLRSSAFTARPLLGASCVLFGGLLLRFVVIMAPQWPNIALWRL